MRGRRDVLLWQRCDGLALHAACLWGGGLCDGVLEWGGILLTACYIRAIVLCYPFCCHIVTLSSLIVVFRDWLGSSLPLCHKERLVAGHQIQRLVYLVAATGERVLFCTICCCVSLLRAGWVMHFGVKVGDVSTSVAGVIDDMVSMPPGSAGSMPGALLLPHIRFFSICCLWLSNLLCHGTTCATDHSALSSWSVSARQLGAPGWLVLLPCTSMCTARQPGDTRTSSHQL